jgi:polar amino acid transport system substrate-binding protein
MNRRTLIRRLLLGTAAIGLLCFGGQNVHATEGWESSPTIKKIKEAGILRVGVAMAAPTAFKDPQSGKLEGIVVQVGEEAAKRLGVKFDASETGWDTIIAGLQSNKYDIALAGLFKTPQREKVIDFVLVGEEGIAFLVRNGNDAIKTTEDLDKAGVTIATVTGSGSEQMIKDHFKNPAIKSILSPTGGSGAPPEEVLAGRVDAAQFDAVLTQAYQKRFPGLKTVPADAFDNPLFPTPIGIGVRKDDPQFRDFLASVVGDLQKQGLIQSWRAQWSQPELLLQ